MSESGLFLQNVIAVIWDFDKTLSPQYMQSPIFEAYGIDEDAFWREVKGLPAYYARAGIKVQEDTCYLTHLLSYVKHGKMPDLSNARLRELGAEIQLYPGLPGAFDKLREIAGEAPFQDADIRVEHYIVSTGLYAMIEGSAIADKVDGIWASVFIEAPAAPGADLSGIPESQPISQIAGFLDNTTKTRAIFEINKGVNKETGIEVNSKIAEEDRRVPFRNMIYIADGPSDVPSFSVVRTNGGKTYAVHDAGSAERMKRVDQLKDQGRVDHYGTADYTEGSATLRWLQMKIHDIATEIVEHRSRAIESRVRPGPTHL